MRGLLTIKFPFTVQSPVSVSFWAIAQFPSYVAPTNTDSRIATGLALGVGLILGEDIASGEGLTASTASSTTLLSGDDVTSGVDVISGNAVGSISGVAIGALSESASVSCPGVEIGVVTGLEADSVSGTGASVFPDVPSGSSLSLPPELSLLTF